MVVANWRKGGMVSTHRVWSNRAGQSVMTSAMMVCICRCCC
ncbi:hypothetical protein HMPREF9592_02332 [Cutibacterium acnes HL046PA1]|nr:hypothetical protein HMPREF9567_01380 [Cutibacterium acnes HL013PA1]EFT00290.1 hypothetical protein HMPREF9609_01150 [Cutibacterium acnes HL027PA1]EFT73158.1 hypothetical protein HMPREF9592_02332 [Cutibacterium acnes HL046PA1]